jgi:hypothetical protein
LQQINPVNDIEHEKAQKIISDFLSGQVISAQV